MRRWRTDTSAGPPAETTVSDATPTAVPLSGQRIELDYPVHPRPRYGAAYGLATHTPMVTVVEGSRRRAAEFIADIARYQTDLRIISVDATSDPLQPCWRNGWVPGLDGAALYAATASRRPAHYLEVGSGNSTKFVRRAITDHSTGTRITSIDPMPRAECDALCDTIIRQPLENADLSVFDQLTGGDVLFIDNSHRALQNSDVTVAMLEVIPRLASGVLVGIHDIFLPDDYPPEWAERFYSEQYVLAAWLLGGHAGADVVLPAYWAARHTDLCAPLAPLWAALPGVETHGGAFWFETT
jgi:hypothetical protein